MHTFFTVPGFIVDTHAPPIHTMFALVDDAARWCSAEVACRAFTLSMLHMQVRVQRADQLRTRCWTLAPDAGHLRTLARVPCLVG